MQTIDKIAIVLLVICITSISSMISYEVAQRGVREQAVIKGYASWKVSDDGSKVTFEWKK